MWVGLGGGGGDGVGVQQSRGELRVYTEYLCVFFFFGFQ